jgi:phage-related protein
MKLQLSHNGCIIDSVSNQPNKENLMLNREILNIDMDMTRRSIYDIEQEVWEAIAEANGLDYEDIADGDLTEWL